jgi:hypothetical protein
MWEAKRASCRVPGARAVGHIFGSCGREQLSTGNQRLPERKAIVFNSATRRQKNRSRATTEIRRCPAEGKRPTTVIFLSTDCGNLLIPFAKHCRSPPRRGEQAAVGAAANFAAPTKLKRYRGILGYGADKMTDANMANALYIESLHRFQRHTGV